MAGKNELKAVKNTKPAKLESFKLTTEEKFRVKSIDKSQQLLSQIAQAVQNDLNNREAELNVEKDEFKELVEKRIGGISIEDYSLDHKTGVATLRKDLDQGPPQGQQHPGLPPGAPASAMAEEEAEEKVG